MSSHSTRTETSLIRECLKGNRKSQKKLYDLYSPTLYSICLKILKDKTNAEDVLQEAFIKIFNKLEQYSGDGSFEGWLKRITFNTAIENLRKIQRGASICLDEVPVGVTTCNQLSALDKLYEKDLIGITHQLSDGYRDVFHLFAVQGYSHNEIATKFEIAEGTSKSQYSRAKSILRKMVPPVS